MGRFGVAGRTTMAWVTALACFAASAPVSATFSIVACEPETGVCGVAVATHNLAVGNSVPFARFGVGAGVSQFETNPCHALAIIGALDAGSEAGGQTIGVLSAALVVATPQGWPVDIDLRVDFAHGTAIVKLREIYDANLARQLLFRASRVESEDAAAALIESAAQLAPGWDRIQLRAARLSARMGRAREAAAYACRFQEINPDWAALLSDELELARCEAP